MSEATKLSVRIREGVPEVRMRVFHEMESGQRKDAAGKLVPAWHITEISATLNGRPVIRSQWGPGVSKNPIFAFRVRTAKTGDKIVVTWVDNRGERRSDEFTVGTL
jgi:thiosulfate oxidation carrier complex protein SoxZ